MTSGFPLRWINPTIWPWTLYVWLTFALVGWLVAAWRRLQQRRAFDWPITTGLIESCQVSKPRFSWTAKRGYYQADLRYSYSIAGSFHSGSYKRSFPTEGAAQDFVRDLAGKPLLVHYKSDPFYLDGAGK